MKKGFLICLLMVVGLLILPCKAYSLDEIGQEVRLYLGEVKFISVNNPVRIAIGNPNIADVTNVTVKEITVTPKSAGRTTLIVWDNFGEQLYNLIVLVENMQETKRRIDNILEKLNLPEVYTKAEDEEGKVFLLGKVKTAQDREKLNMALGGFKDKIMDFIEIKEEEAMLDIDVQVLELDSDATRTLGLTVPSSITLTEQGSAGITSVGTKWSALFKVLNLNREAFVWILDALVQEGKARILSRPRLVCQSGREAELLVGGEKPTFTTEVVSGGGAGTTVEYKEYGIKLKIKPRLTEKDRIKLALNVEVSEVGAPESIGTTTTGTTTARAYPLTKRNVSTELSLNNGETVAIGGLIKQKTEEDIRKLPGLGDVPILGLFFRKKTTKIGGGQGERGNTELFITLTPKIATEEKQGASKPAPAPEPLKSKEESIKELKVKEKPNEEPQKVEPKKKISPSIPSIGQNLSGPIPEYSAIIQKRILNNLSYPTSAKNAGFQGTVKLSLLLSYRGELLDVKIKESSGYNLLDEYTLKVAKDIGSYPPFPPSIESKEIWIDVPVVYKLD